MSTNYPSSLDNGTSLPDPSATNDTNSPSLSSGQTNQNDALIAIETLVGTNASQTTPAAQYNVLQASSSSASEWAKITSSNVSASTGTGSFVFASSPTLSTPTLNSPTITTPTISGSLGSITTGTITSSGLITANSGVSTTTLTASDSITASSGITIPNGSTLTVNSSPVWVYLGAVQTTSGFTTTSTSQTQVTGMSVTVTIPSGYTKVRISVSGRDWYNSTAIANSYCTIWRGTVGSGTQVATSFIISNQQSLPLSFFGLDSPTAGSVTYNLGLNTSNVSDASNIEAGSGYPLSMVVEVC